LHILRLLKMQVSHLLLDGHASGQELLEFQQDKPAVEHGVSQGVGKVFRVM
jgi:hypothetical protein